MDVDEEFESEGVLLRGRILGDRLRLLGNTICGDSHCLSKFSLSSVKKYSRNLLLGLVNRHL